MFLGTSRCSPLCGSRRKTSPGQLGDSIRRWKLLRRFADVGIDCTELLRSLTTRGKSDNRIVFYNTMTLILCKKRAPDRGFALINATGMRFLAARYQIWYSLEHLKVASFVVFLR
jgi:hypothetical protein